MSETEYDTEKTPVPAEQKPGHGPVDVEVAEEGEVAPLKRHLRGRHMQMIAIGKACSRREGEQ